MSMSAPARFTFDLDLAKTAENSRVMRDSEVERLLAEAEEKGYARGVEDGRNDAGIKATEALAAATEKLVGKTAQVGAAADKKHRELMADAAQLAVITARKLAANLIARQPLSEITALMEECLSSLGDVPHLVIRCHPDLADAIKPEAEKRIALSGFSGRLIIMGEPEISLGDARIEWVDGGVIRDLGEINAEIDQKLGEFIKSNGAKGAGKVDQ